MNLLGRLALKLLGIDIEKLGWDKSAVESLSAHVDEVVGLVIPDAWEGSE